MDFNTYSFEDYVKSLTDKIRMHDEETIRKMADSISSYSKVIRNVLFEHIKNCEACKTIYDEQKGKANEMYLEDLRQKLEDHSKRLIEAYAKAGRTFSVQAKETIQKHIDDCAVCKEIYDTVSKSLINSLKLASNNEIQEYGTQRTTSISARSANSRSRRVGRQYIRTK